MIRANYTPPTIAHAKCSAGNGACCISLHNLHQQECVHSDAFLNVITSLRKQMNSKKLICASVLVLLAAFLGLAQDKNNGAIKGKVRVERGSAAGVAVILRQEDREIMRTTTDKKGDFVLSRVNPGIYGVTLRKPGLAVGSIEKIEVRAGQTRALGDHLFLKIDEGSIAFIKGSVFSEGGRLVRGVRVELAKIVDANSTQKLDARITDEDGAFVFRLPPEPAKYRVTLKAEGSEPVTKDVEVESAAVYRVSLTLKSNPK